MCTRIVIVLLVLVLSTSACANFAALGDVEHVEPALPSPKGYSSPRAAFDAYKKALKEKDWRTLFSCRTPQYQDLCVKELIFASRTRVDPLLTATLKKYGVDFDQVNEDYAKGLPNRPIDARALWRLTFDRVTNKARLFEEAQAIIYKERDPQPLGGLQDLRVQGNTAAGRANSTMVSWEYAPGREPKKRESTYPKEFYFLRLSGRWYLASGPEEMRSRERTAPLPPQQ
ncbi:MAG: hypothetical protein ACYTG0_25795 [Planctomycetota bacterium]|jgi:hypothetical protein